MRLAESFQSVLILDDTGATNRDEAIEAILDQMSADGLFPSTLASELRAAVIRRDELGPTGIGEGVAIPHVWHAGHDLPPRTVWKGKAILHRCTRWAMQYDRRGSTRASRGLPPFWSGANVSGWKTERRPRHVLLENQFGCLTGHSMKERYHATDARDCFVGGLYGLDPVGGGRRILFAPRRLPLRRQMPRGAALLPFARMLRAAPPLLRQCLGRVLPGEGPLGHVLVQARDRSALSLHSPCNLRRLRRSPASSAPRGGSRVRVPELRHRGSCRAAVSLAVYGAMLTY